MSDFDEAVGRQPPDGRDDVGFTYRVDRKRYEELRESVENLIPGLQEQIRRQESVEDMLVANIEVTIETLTRGDEIPVAEGADPSKPPDPNPMQSVIDRLQTVLDAAERGVIV